MDKEKREHAMKREFERFDMKRPPVPTRWFLRPLTYLLSAPDVKSTARSSAEKGRRGSGLLM